MNTRRSIRCVPCQRLNVIVRPLPSYTNWWSSTWITFRRDTSPMAMEFVVFRALARVSVLIIIPSFTFHVPWNANSSVPFVRWLEALPSETNTITPRITPEFKYQVPAICWRSCASRRSHDVNRRLKTTNISAFLTLFPMMLQFTGNGRLGLQFILCHGIECLRKQTGCFPSHVVSIRPPAGKVKFDVWPRTVAGTNCLDRMAASDWLRAKLF